MKIFLLKVWSPGGAAIIFPKSGQNQNLTPLLLIKKLLLPLLSVNEIFLGWTVLDLWIFCPKWTPPLWIFKFYIFDQKPFSTKNPNSVMKTEWEKYPILSVLVIELKLFHTTEEGSIEDKKFISPKRFIREKFRLQKVGVTEVFFWSKSGVRFSFRAFFGKMIAAPPGCKCLRTKILVWVQSVVVHSIQNMFKTPGGIRWEIFFVQMSSDKQVLLRSYCKVLTWVLLI